MYLGCEIWKYGNVQNEVGIRFGKVGFALRILNKLSNTCGGVDSNTWMQIVEKVELKRKTSEKI